MKESPLKILIVEDEQIVALDLEALLRDLDYDVIGPAATAAQAVALAGEARPDLVLMDINLGGQPDGIQAAQEIRERFELPVIFLTAYDDDATLAQAQVTEPYGYLLKPLSGRELRVSIRMAVYHHQMQCERERLRNELEAALRENRTLQGLLSMCARCRKIRDEDRWLPLETYVQKHSAATFSHGYCPECAQQYLAELDKADRA